MDFMEITVRAMPRALFVRLDGELDLHTAPEFKARVKAAFERAPHLTTLIVVLTDVRFIDSSGLGALLAQYRELSQRAGRLILVDPRPSVLRVLEFSGLLRVIDVVETEEKALLRA
jgi:stage II sporulation protein AA (anti-sigma F factor antagonist)